MTQMLEMKVWKLSVDPANEMPLVLLRDDSGQETLPLWVGLAEASAIAAELEKIKLERPMTHDLMKNMLDAFSVRVVQVEVNEVRSNAFHGCLVLEQEGKRAEVPCRPSDAVALALRTGAPILVARRVLDRIRQIELTRKWLDEPTPPASQPEAEVDPEAVRDFLAGLSRKRFGKWKM
jgi:bifunctional DNase/RNase